MPVVIFYFYFYPHVILDFSSMLMVPHLNPQHPTIFLFQNFVMSCQLRCAVPPLAPHCWGALVLASVEELLLPRLQEPHLLTFRSGFGGV